tara:strand:- start:566 stop:973 length:408 start_codon:yes stop_codon:yes gene_type:complete
MKLLLFILLFSPCVLYSQEAPLLNEKLTTDEEIFMKAEEMPEFPGGYEGLAKYLSDSITYPAIAKEYNIQGKVFVQFVVEKNGKVSNIKVVKGVDKNLDKEAVRVVQSLPDWKPGEQKGKAVRVLITIPINFRLN